MVSLDEINRQLKQVGAVFHFWGRAEVRELPNILFEGEEIKSCINGRYSDGFGLLCATDQRILLVDKKPFFLTVEDVRYDMISEVDFGYRLIESTIKVRAPNKTLSFTSWRHKELRNLCSYVQQRVTEIRQGHSNPSPQQYQPEPSPSSLQPNSHIASVATQQSSFGSAATTKASPQVVSATGNIALIGHSLANVLQRVPTTVRNPYISGSLMTRHRVGLFGMGRRKTTK